MKILFISHFYAPHVGGVETHSAEVAKALQKMGHKVTILIEKHDKNLKRWELIDGVKVVRFSYPHIKYLGLLFIWVALWRNRKLIKEADVIHIHDVFIWYLPFIFLYAYKNVYTTFHGWEGTWPIPKRNIKLKKLAAKYSDGTIAVGQYIEKYYDIKPNKVVYGGMSSHKLNTNHKKEKNKLVFVGRLEKDTGLLKFLKRLNDFEYRKVLFIGDGSLWKEASKYGKVQGFTDPRPFLESAEYAVPGGYLSYIEALTYGCKILVYPDNPLKNDYWKEILKIKTFPEWREVANVYLELWKEP